MVRRAVLLAAAVALVSATKELTPKDFEKEVHNSGKGAFVKFLAPWCGHCKSLKPDWDKLAKAYKDSGSVGIFDVDCDAAGKPLCGEYDVKGFPTIKYFTKKTGKKGTAYNGGRDYNSLKSFVDSTFKASCDVLTGKGCNDQEKRYIEKTKDKSAAELATERTEKETELKAVKKERTDAEKELADKAKKWKSKETALTKAVELVKQFEKAAKNKAKDDL